jgi:CheY-like chemotaxis protein
VGSAADGEQPVALAKRTAPDVVLMDTWLPRLDGVEATVHLRAARTPQL